MASIPRPVERPKFTTHEDEAKSVRFGEWQGKPMIIFGDENEQYPLQFGKAKAKKLLNAMASLGADRIYEYLEHLIEDQ